jgi:hypothetical protein
VRKAGKQQRHNCAPVRPRSIIGLERRDARSMVRGVVQTSTADHNQPRGAKCCEVRSRTLTSSLWCSIESPLQGCRLPYCRFRCAKGCSSSMDNTQCVQRRSSDAVRLSTERSMIGLEGR